MTIHTDILILGGGPAGLLLASQLPQHFKTKVIEKGRVGQTDKYWVTTERRLRAQGMERCITSRSDRMFAGTFLGSALNIPGDFVVVNEVDFLKTLSDRCLEHGIEIAEDCSLFNLSWKTDSIQVATTRETYATRLLIDATGSQSPIAETFHLSRIEGFFSVFGAHIERISLKTDSIVLAYVDQLGNPPPVLEVVPTGPDSAFCAVFIYSKRLVPPTALDSVFRSHCAKNSFFEITSASSFGRQKSGAISIGMRTRRQLPRVIPIGEAALAQPPLLGTAFNEILEYSHQVAAHVVSVLSDEKTVDKPAFRYPYIKQTQDLFQLALMKRLLVGKVEDFDLMIRHLQNVSPKRVFNLCSNELDWPNLIAAAGQFSRSLLFASIARG